MEKLKYTDHVDLVISQWNNVMPEHDVSPMGIFTRLLRFSKYFDRHVSTVFRREGLHSGEFDLLATLYRSGQEQGLTPNELLSSVVLSSGAMTNRLDRLEGAGHIKRLPNPDDRRSVLIQLTETGKKLILHLLDEYLKTLQMLQAPLEDHQKNELASTLRILLLALEAKENV